MNKTMTLKEMLVADLNPAFVRELVDGMPGIYKDAHEAMNEDPGLGEVQARGVVGHYRRGRSEAFLQRSAVKYGVPQKDTKPKGGGISHISIFAERFELVMCHVPSSDSFPQHSFDREESSKANEFISQIEMFNEPEPPTEKGLFGVIIHSEQTGKKDTFGSIKIGFPNTDFTDWVEAPVCLMEIRDIQAMMYQKKADLQGQVQNADLKWKSTNQETKEESKSSKEGK